MRATAPCLVLVGWRERPVGVATVGDLEEGGSMSRRDLLMAYKVAMLGA